MLLRVPLSGCFKSSSILKSVAPQLKHLLIRLFLGRRVLGVPYARVAVKGIGHVLLLYKVAWIVVSVLVAVVIAQALHKLCRGVAQMERNRLVASATYQ